MPDIVIYIAFEISALKHMEDNLQKRTLIMALYAGELMMKNGAEVYRVEDTIHRICKAYDYPYVEVFAMPTGIFASVDDGENSGSNTYIKRIKGSDIDLDKISQLNNFSRKFTSTDLSVSDGMELLKNIEKEPGYPRLIKILGATMVTTFMCLVLGGTFSDIPAAFFVGIISYSMAILLDVIKINYFIKDFCCAAIAAFLALLFCSLGLGANSNAITIGALMMFVPGVAITNSIRDLLSSDILAGITRLAEAIIIAISLAAGAGFAITLWTLLGGVM